MATTNPITDNQTASGDRNAGTFRPSDRVINIPDNLLIGVVVYLIYVSCF